MATISGAPPRLALDRLLSVLARAAGFDSHMESFHEATGYHPRPRTLHALEDTCGLASPRAPAQARRQKARKKRRAWSREEEDSLKKIITSAPPSSVWASDVAGAALSAHACSLCSEPRSQAAALSKAWTATL